MSAVLGINAAFHDSSAALVVDGSIVAAAEEERFSRRKHGKDAVPFSTWELPLQSAQWCLDAGAIGPSDLDAVVYAYEPGLAQRAGPDITDLKWEGLRTLFAERAPLFLEAGLPGIDRTRVGFVAHHLAHAASAFLAGPHRSSAVMVLDGRGERSSYLAGHSHDGGFDVLARVALPSSLGFMYEGLSRHLGYRAGTDEYKIMALASYGEPRHLEAFRRLVRLDGNGGFVTDPIDWSTFAPAGTGDGTLDPAHADLAASVQRRLEEVELDLATWLHDRTGEPALSMAGGVALNCVANSWVFDAGPFEDVWVQPAAGDSGTALGAALLKATALGDNVQPMETAALGREWSDAQIEATLRDAAIVFERPTNIADAAAAVLAADGIVAWFQGRSEFGPRALGHRSLLAHPGRAENLERLNLVKGREQFRPVAPMVTLERAKDVFEGGPIPSPYMLFTHRVRDEWRDRIPAVVHVDGTSRAQTVDRADEPLVHRMLSEFERQTALPVVVNTSLNTAGRPMVDDPRDALECFGSAPIDALAIGPFLIRRRTR
ncbi:MAG: carbamoyltransferase [Actinomycetota bacterium]|jgi:carbamoyltransferase|nr:carbamoyltransferase [Actinomycetota bacterium]